MAHMNNAITPFSIGTQCYNEIHYHTKEYGRTAVVIGGNISIKKAKPFLIDSLASTKINITDFIHYGNDSAYENVLKLTMNARGGADVFLD